ncbi:MAG: type pilus assembly PilZ [Bryobacterales bacterium]|nr:type pilus assembly PilZ [Bryobacterales bacterium]
MGLQQTREADRRRSDRFDIERDLRFRALNKRGGEEAGEGKTVNMSSSGVLFTSGQILRPGRRVELAISWPAQLNNKCALRLVARGRIVRFENGLAAMEIQQYEFRTQSAPGLASAVAGMAKLAVM